MASTEHIWREMDRLTVIFDRQADLLVDLRTRVALIEQATQARLDLLEKTVLEIKTRKSPTGCGHSGPGVIGGIVKLFSTPWFGKLALLIILILSNIGLEKAVSLIAKLG